jgi:ubiquinone/menaquinone biosynthesis C-methylase UbiE
MSERVNIVKSFYEEVDEEQRLQKSRHGQLEFRTTMEYIHGLISEGAKILEVGAGTGRYSIALANEGYEVTAVELLENNLKVLKENGQGLNNLQAFQGDALDLSRWADNTFDLTLVLGPMYHLYEKDQIHKAIDEAIRVTKKDGVSFFAFLSVYAILFNNYLKEDLQDGIEENFTEKYEIRHFEEQLFTGYDIVEFEKLFADKEIEYISTVAADTILELARKRTDFVMSDEDFEAFAKYHLATCEIRELLGSSSHLLYICRKK